MDLNKTIQNFLDNIDLSEMVEKEIRNQIHGDVARTIRDCIKNKVDDLIKVEFDIIMRQGIETDDGWGKKESFDSFEDLFKKEFKNKLNESWEMKRTIEKIVKSKLDSLFKNELDKVIKSFADQLISKSNEWKQ